MKRYDGGREDTPTLDPTGDFVRYSDVERQYTMAKELHAFYPGPFPSSAVRRLLDTILEDTP